MKTKPEVSVVIPSYNEATYIGRLLQALSKQTHDNFEVIVSDAKSKDGTADVVKRYNKRINVKLVSSPPKGPSAGRNKGAALASGKWLLFLDADDDIDDPDFIKTMIAAADKNNWVVASATMRARDASLRERFGIGFNYRYIKLLARTKHPVSPGWCILTLRDVFNAHKGFNEGIHFGEDYDYVSRAGRYSFGFVEQTYYYVDLPRARQEGWRLTIKAIGNEIYRHTHSYNLENNPFKYEFGKHKRRK